MKVFDKKEEDVVQSWLFLLLIALISFVAHNKSLLFATIFVLILKLFMPLSSSLMDTIHSKGINWGVTIISISILIPIATGEIGFKNLMDAFKKPLGWLAILCGILVAILSKKGVGLIGASPEITVALVFGTILGVVIFRGIAAGPVIAAGMTYCLFSLFQMIWH